MLISYNKILFELGTFFAHDHERRDKIRKNDVARKQIRRIVRNVTAEEAREHNPHDEQCQKRREHTPSHAEQRALIFFSKVSFCQFLNQELILSYFLKHVISTKSQINYSLLIVETFCPLNHKLLLSSYWKHFFSNKSITWLK